MPSYTKPTKFKQHWEMLSPVMTRFLNVGANVNHYQEGEAPYNTPASLPEKRLQCDSTHSMGKA
jgi:hypothetical protein